MRLLWVPFLPIGSTGWEGSRHFHFLRRLAVRHEIHLIAWDRWGKPASGTPAGLREGATVQLHPITLAPNVWRLWRRDYPRDIDLIPNRILLEGIIAKVAREHKPDAIVLSVTHYATGLPRLPSGIPVILDHVDECPPWVGEQYFRVVDGICAVSETLRDSAAAKHPHVELIPNGVELGAYSPDRREAAKAVLGLSGRVVISLIGLTCSHRLYFLEAFADFAKEHPGAVLLLVGDSPLLGEMKERISQLQADIRIMGHLPFGQVATYFNATDIGLYPGDDTPYYRQAHPLKVVEYTASGVQVVSSPVDAFRDGWTNVWTCEASREGFHEGMLEALRTPRPCKDVSTMGWDGGAKRFEQFLGKVIAESKFQAQRAGI